MHRRLALVLSLAVLALATWLGGALRGEKPAAAWEQVAPGIWRTSAMPHGHSRDHAAFAVTREAAQSPWVFCGDALAAPGKLWAPFTTDCDHWTDAGLSPTVKSLRALAELKPRALYPAHGAPITQQCAEA